MGMCQVSHDYDHEDCDGAMTMMTNMYDNLKLIIKTRRKNSFPDVITLKSNAH